MCGERKEGEMEKEARKSRLRGSEGKSDTPKAACEIFNCVERNP